MYISFLFWSLLMYLVTFLTCWQPSLCQFQDSIEETMGANFCKDKRLQAGKPTEIKCERNFLFKPSECFRHQEVASDLEVLTFRSQENYSKE